MEPQGKEGSRCFHWRNERCWTKLTHTNSLPIWPRHFLKQTEAVGVFALIFLIHSYLRCLLPSIVSLTNKRCSVYHQLRFKISGFRKLTAYGGRSLHISSMLRRWGASTLVQDQLFHHASNSTHDLDSKPSASSRTWSILTLIFLFYALFLPISFFSSACMDRNMFLSYEKTLWTCLHLGSQ